MLVLFDDLLRLLADFLSVACQGQLKIGFGSAPLVCGLDGHGLLRT